MLTKRKSKQYNYFGYIDDCIKAMHVIESCNTIEQCHYASEYIKLLLHKYKHEEISMNQSYWDKVLRRKLNSITSDIVRGDGHVKDIPQRKN